MPEASTNAVHVLGAVPVAAVARRRHRYGRAVARRLTCHVAIGGAAVCLVSCSGEASPLREPVPEPPQRDGGVSAAGSDAALACGNPDAGRASATPPPRRGPALSVGERVGPFVPVWDEAGSSGINGPAFMIQSRLGGNGPVTTPATFSAPEGKLCLAGNTVIIPLMNFGDYWGAEIEMYLNAGIRAPGAAEAFSTATAPGWDPAAANVIGFSFVVEGNAPDLPCAGVPPLLRFEAAPSGGDLSTDIFCHELRGVSSGSTVDVFFSEVTRDCWEPGGRAIFAEPRPAGFTGELQNVQWSIPADEVASYAFDICISDIRPILGG